MLGAMYVKRKAHAEKQPSDKGIKDLALTQTTAKVAKECQIEDKEIPLKLDCVPHGNAHDQTDDRHHEDLLNQLDDEIRDDPVQAVTMLTIKQLTI